MKWVTRERAKVDRIACPWLIKKFVDPAAEFVFVPADRVVEVAREQGAIPFDASGVELTHYKDGGKEYVSFDAVIRKYKLSDPALLELAKIVRGADAKIPDAPPESAGLEAAAAGFRAVARDDHENMKLQFPFYDALYQYCKGRLEGSVKLEHAKPGS
ncbi:MAG: chromate resistance protein [Thaumarchaeota archaeon]|nr:chromate resistance protein [Nitrososphaerota archaeon]